MNTPAAVMFQYNLDNARREALLETARDTILALPGITREGSIVLNANIERSSMCIRFMSNFPRVDTQNGSILAIRLAEWNIKCIMSPSLGMIHMDLGDFLVNLSKLVVEKFGERCADTGTCHHECKDQCFRKSCCVPLMISGLDDKWNPIEPKRAVDMSIRDDRTATYVDDDDTVLNNGIFNVKNRVVTYRGFTIKPKLDFGSYPHRNHGNVISTGWVVIKDGCLALPGATWSESILSARASIDIWIEANFNAEKYWELMAPYRY